MLKKNLKELKVVSQNAIYISISWYIKFLIYQSLLISDEKNADISRTQGVCHVIHIFFGYFLGKV